MRLRNSVATAARRRAASIPRKPTGRPVTRTARAGSVAGLHVSDFRDLMEQWDYAKNGTLDPHDVPAGTGLKVWWRCPNGPDHSWDAVVRSRTIRGSNCPFETGHRLAASQTLAATHPEIAKWWHPSNTRKPDQVSRASHIYAMWQCPTYKTHVFRMRVDFRVVAVYPCPICAEAAGKGGRRKQTDARRGAA